MHCYSHTHTTHTSRTQVFYYAHFAIIPIFSLNFPNQKKKNVQRNYSENIDTDTINLLICMWRAIVICDRPCANLHLSDAPLWVVNDVWLCCVCVFFLSKSTASSFHNGWFIFIKICYYDYLMSNQFGNAKYCVCSDFMSVCIQSSTYIGL